MRMHAWARKIMRRVRRKRRLNDANLVRSVQLNFSLEDPLGVPVGVPEGSPDP